MGSGAKEINVNTLEDIFELPCFENMVEDLRVENGGPVRKDLYNFVAMVMWLQNYHKMSHENMKQAVVDDVAISSKRSGIGTTQPKPTIRLVMKLTTGLSTVKMPFRWGATTTT